MEDTESNLNSCAMKEEILLLGGPASGSVKVGKTKAADIVKVG